MGRKKLTGSPLAQFCKVLLVNWLGGEAPPNGAYRTTATTLSVLPFLATCVRPEHATLPPWEYPMTANFICGHSADLVLMRLAMSLGPWVERKEDIVASYCSKCKQKKEAHLD
jgi:hypothetical protein